MPAPMAPSPAKPTRSMSLNIGGTLAGPLRDGPARARLGGVSELAVVGPGGGEVIGDAPDRRVEIVCEHEAVHATWARFGPHREGADLHVHRRHTDLFHVLEGELTLRLGPDGAEVPVPAGTLVVVPPLVVHGYRNGS